MRVILTKDVVGIGKKGEVKEVKDGFALNFLLPRKFATLPKSDLAEKISQEKISQEKLRQASQQSAYELAKKWQGQTILIRAKAGEGGKLFGGITAADIASQMKIDKKFVKLDKPIKQLGEVNVGIAFGSDTKSSVRVIVEPIE